MATIYCDSNASGLDDGTSWTDAYQTFQQAWTNWGNGDVVWWAYNSSETVASKSFGSNASADLQEPVLIYSVDPADDNYRIATAFQMSCSGSTFIHFPDNSQWYGCYLKPGDCDLMLGEVNNWDSEMTSLEDCTVEFVVAAFQNRVMSPWFGVHAKRCTFNNTGVSTGAYRVTSVHPSLYEDCTFSGPANASAFVECSWRGLAFPGGTTIFRGCDFTGLTSVTDINQNVACITFESCNLASGDGFIAPNALNKMSRLTATAVDGASTAKTYIQEMYFRQGTVTQDTAIYRDAGWVSVEGDTPLSHKMSPTANLIGPNTPFYGPNLYAYVTTTGSTTFTVYGVEDFATSPTEDNCWMELLSLETTNSVKSTMAGGRVIFSTTGLTSDTDAWTGASGKTKFKLSETVTINKAGWYSLRVYLGYYESAKALWYCPLVGVA